MAIRATATPASASKRGPGRPPKAPPAPVAAAPVAPPRPMPRQGGPVAPVPQTPADVARAKLAAGKPLTSAEAMALSMAQHAAVAAGQAPAARPRPAGVRPGLPSVPPTAPVDVAALQKQIKLQADAIVQLEATVAKLKAKPTNVRTIDEIVGTEDAPGNAGLAQDDWRHDYQGATIQAYQYDTSKDDAAISVVYDGMLTEDGTAYATGHGEMMPTISCLLAVPRETDVGGKGKAARALGKLALHFVVSEDGTTYEGQPEYHTAEQLAAVWAS